jgi:hypothetical protein
VVERPPLDREVRGSNPSHDTMALLLGRHYEFPQCGIIKGKLLIIIIRPFAYSPRLFRNVYLLLFSAAGVVVMHYCTI